MKLPFDFAFEGFRIVREKPSLLLPWGLLTLVGFGASTLIMWTLAGQGMAELERAMVANDQAAQLAAYAKVGPAYALAFPINVLIQAVSACAIFRVVLGKEPSAFGRLRFGMDELRQIAVNILFYLIFTGIYIAALLPGLIIGASFSAILGGPTTPAGMVGVFLGLIPTLLAVFYMISRLSLCFVQSFDQKRITMFGSWALTRGNAGTLMLGYFTALVMATIVFILCLGTFAAIAIAASGGDFSAYERMQETARLGIQGLSNPVTAAYLIVSNGIVAPLLMAISFGAPAAAYKRLANGGVGAENVF
jgi:hypothetical protein